MWMQQQHAACQVWGAGSQTARLPCQTRLLAQIWQIWNAPAPFCMQGVGRLRGRGAQSRSCGCVRGQGAEWRPYAPPRTAQLQQLTAPGVRTMPEKARLARRCIGPAFTGRCTAPLPSHPQADVRPCMMHARQRSLCSNRNPQVCWRAAATKTRLPSPRRTHAACPPYLLGLGTHPTPGPGRPMASSVRRPTASSVWPPSKARATPPQPQSQVHLQDHHRGNMLLMRAYGAPIQVAWGDRVGWRCCFCLLQSLEAGPALKTARPAWSWRVLYS